MDRADSRALVAAPRSALRFGVVAAVVLAGGATAGAQDPPGPPPEASAVVHGEAAPSRTAGEYALPVGLLGRVPRLDATEALALVPGVSLTNEAAAGDAPEVYLRGFAGDNGQDIAFSVAGVPVNDESNPLTHGNADLYFVIPELIEQLDATEGVADPRHGNFGLAGAIDYRLGLAQRGITLRGSVGSYGYHRLVALYGPASLSNRTFAGAELVHSDGFGPRRAWDRVTGLAQHVIELGGGTTLAFLAGMYAGSWQNPGVVRQDDYAAGRAGFFDVYPGIGDQAGYSVHALLASTLAWEAAAEHAELRVYGRLRDFGQSANPDGFLQDPVHGDLLAERYSGGTVGATGLYRRRATLAGRVQELEAGFALRHDRYAVTEQNLDATTNAPTVPPSPADTAGALRVTNPAFYVDGTVRPFTWLALRGGLRVDALAYDVDTTAFDAAQRAFVTGHAHAFGAHLGPKGSLVVGPWRGFRVLASAGTGFRSPDARAVADGGPVRVTTATTEDLTLRYTLPARPGGARWSARWSASITGFHTYVDLDAIFDPTAGTAVDVGATDRLGAVFWTRLQPAPWIDVNASAAFTRSTVEAPPAAAFGHRLAAGAAIPYLPEWVARIDVAADRQVGAVRGAPIRFHGGLGASVRGPSALVTLPATAPTFLVDAGAGVRVGFVGVDLALKNLFDARWHGADFEYASNFRMGAPADATPARHFVAGAPRTFFATLSLYL